MTDIYTTDQLLDMSGGRFRSAVTEDLYVTCDWNGPFQDERVIGRTMFALNSWIETVNADLDERAADPNCPPDLYERTDKFRNHLLNVIANTDRRIESLSESKTREARRWKQVLFEVVDAIQQGWDDDDILAIKIPDFRDSEAAFTVETWHQIRLAKQPNRKRAVAA